MNEINILVLLDLYFSVGGESENKQFGFNVINDLYNFSFILIFFFQLATENPLLNST